MWWSGRQDSRQSSTSCLSEPVMKPTSKAKESFALPLALLSQLVPGLLLTLPALLQLQVVLLVQLLLFLQGLLTCVWPGQLNFPAPAGSEE